VDPKQVTMSEDLAQAFLQEVEHLLQCHLPECRVCHRFRRLSDRRRRQTRTGFTILLTLALTNNTPLPEVLQLGLDLLA